MSPSAHDPKRWGPRRSFIPIGRPLRLVRAIRGELGGERDGYELECEHIALSVDEAGGRAIGDLVPCERCFQEARAR